MGKVNTLSVIRRKISKSFVLTICHNVVNNSDSLSGQNSQNCLPIESINYAQKHGILSCFNTSELLSMQYALILLITSRLAANSRESIRTRYAGKRQTGQRRAYRAWQETLRASPGGGSALSEGMPPVTGTPPLSPGALLEVSRAR